MTSLNTYLEYTFTCNLDQKFPYDKTTMNSDVKCNFSNVVAESMENCRIDAEQINSTLGELNQN